MIENAHAGISARGDRSSGGHHLSGDRHRLDRGHGQDRPKGRLFGMVRAAGVRPDREHHHVLRLRFFRLARAKRAPSVPPRRLRPRRVPRTGLADAAPFGLARGGPPGYGPGPAGYIPNTPPGYGSGGPQYPPSSWPVPPATPVPPETGPWASPPSVGPSPGTGGASTAPPPWPEAAPPNEPGA